MYSASVNIHIKHDNKEILQSQWNWLWRSQTGCFEKLNSWQLGKWLLVCFCGQCRLSYLFLADRSETRCHILLFDMICILRCSPWFSLLYNMVTYYTILTHRLIYPPCKSKPVYLSTSDFSDEQGADRTLFIFFNSFCFSPFCVKHREYCVWKSHEISSFWNTWTRPSGINNHATVLSHCDHIFSPFWCLVWAFKWSSRSVSAVIYALW